MSENINFIPANELPIAEGDEVSVLCLENGEMKQKAASGLGGGGFTPIVLKAEDAPYQESNGETLYFVSCELYKKLMNGEVIMPVVLKNNRINYPYTCTIPDNPDTESEYAEFYMFGYEDVLMYLFPNEAAAFNYYDR